MNNIKKFILNKIKAVDKEAFFTYVILIAVFSFTIKDFYNYYYSNQDNIDTILLLLAMFGIPTAIIIKLNGYNTFKKTISKLFLAIFHIVKYLIVILLIVWIINSWNNLADMEKLQWIGFLIIFLLIAIIVKDKQ